MAQAGAGGVNIARKAQECGELIGAPHQRGEHGGGVEPLGPGLVGSPPGSTRTSSHDRVYYIMWKLEYRRWWSFFAAS